jgi:hypothetical protein
VSSPIRFAAFVEGMCEEQAADPVFNDVFSRRYPDAPACRRSAAGRWPSAPASSPTPSPAARSGLASPPATCSASDSTSE